MADQQQLLASNAATELLAWVRDVQVRMRCAPDGAISVRSRRMVERTLREAQALVSDDFVSGIIDELCADQFWVLVETPEVVHWIQVRLCLAYGLDPDYPQTASLADGHGAS